MAMKMLTSPVEVVGELSAIMTCPICMEKYDNTLRIAKLLPTCHHTFCIICLENLVTQDGIINCPTCRKIACNVDVRNLQNNFYFVQLNDVISCNFAVAEDGKKPQDYHINIKVCEPSKRGKGLSSFIFYKVVTETDFFQFDKNSVVYRRFSDFVYLHEQFVSSHQNNGWIMPVPPPKSTFNMLKMKMRDDWKMDGFIMQRQMALERYLCRIARHPVLQRDSHFQQFLQWDVELSKVPRNSISLSDIGFWWLFNSSGTYHRCSLGKDEVDACFEQQFIKIDLMQQKYQQLVMDLGSAVHQREALSDCFSTLSKGCQTIEESPELTSISKAFEIISNSDISLAEAHTCLILEFLKDYIVLFSSIKTSFSVRVKVFDNWQDFQQKLKAKLAEVTDGERGGKLCESKLEKLRKERLLLKDSVTTSYDKFQEVSANLQVDLVRCESMRLSELQFIRNKYFKTLIRHHRAVLTQLEKIHE